MDQLQKRLAILEGRLRAAKAIQILKSSAGWAEFVKECRALKDRSLRNLLDADQKDRDHQAGFCSGLLAVVDLMDDVDEETKRIEDEFRRLANRDVEKDPIGGVR